MAVDSAAGGAPATTAVGTATAEVSATEVERGVATVQKCLLP